MLKTTKWLLLGAVLLLTTAPALAVPVNYNLDSGNIQIQAFNTLTTDLVFDQTLTLKNTSFMNFDPTGAAVFFGFGTLEDFRLEIDENQGPFGLTTPFGPFDMVTVESALITPTVGYQNNVTSPAGPNSFAVNAGPINISAFYGASALSGVPAPVTGVEALITGATNLVGTVNLLTGGIQLSLTGLVMGTVSGAPFGEAGDLSLTGNITFFGSEGAPIPEPATGMLVSLGLVGMAAARRGRHQS